MSADRDTQALRLSIELVPATSWGANLRALLPAAEWDRLRRQVYAASERRCVICGARGRLHAHEQWDFDDARHIQRLRGLVALCTLCHHVKHLGHARLLAARGQLDYERVVAHFLRVNGCDRAAFERHCAAAFTRFDERSRYEWQIELQ